MQPYFFPYLGYVSLLKHADAFILFDTVQFIRHGWIERNRILKPNGGWQYIQIPLQKYHQNTVIKDIKINNQTDWKNKIKSQLQHYKKKAPFYVETMSVINDIFSENYDDIVGLNYSILDNVCSYLKIEKNIKIFSKMDLFIEPALAPDEWALNICRAIDGVDGYWNPPGGISFFDKSKYEKYNIDLKFHSINLLPYKQFDSAFEEGLSIIDVMMFNSVDSINNMLDNYVLL